MLIEAELDGDAAIDRGLEEIIVGAPAVFATGIDKETVKMVFQAGVGGEGRVGLPGAAYKGEANIGHGNKRLARPHHEARVYSHGFIPDG